MPTRFWTRIGLVCGQVSGKATQWEILLDVAPMEVSKASLLDVITTASWKAGSLLYARDVRIEGLGGRAPQIGAKSRCAIQFWVSSLVVLEGHVPLRTWVTVPFDSGYPYSWLPLLLAALTLGYPYSWLLLVLATLALGYSRSWLPLLLATLTLGYPYS